MPLTISMSPFPAIFAQLPQHGHMVTVLTFYDMNPGQIKRNTPELIKYDYKSRGIEYANEHST